MKYSLLIFTILMSYFSNAQLKLDYQKPSDEILDLVDVELAPSVMMDNEKSVMVLRYRNAYKSIEELSEEEMRLAGLRINPKTNIGSRTNYYNNVLLKYLRKADDAIIEIEGLPEKPRLANFSWSPDQKKIAMTHTTDEGVELWYVDLLTAKARKLTDAVLNANMRDVINWFEDSESVLVKILPVNRKPLIDVAEAVPTGPTISMAEGEKAQNRTYQDLLKNKNDEHNFEQLALSDLYKVALNGSKTLWKSTAMYSNISFSPRW